MKTLQDPDLETDEEKEFRQRYPLDLTPDYMHDLEAKAPTKKREQDFDLNDPSTWYDTHPATGESVMTPGFKKHYQGPSKLNPRRVEDSYEYMEEKSPFGQTEVWQRPHTFGQEHEWYPYNPDEVDEGIDPNMDPMTFAKKLNRTEQTELTVLQSKKENADALGMPWTNKDQKKLQNLLDKQKEGSLTIDQEKYVV